MMKEWKKVFWLLLAAIGFRVLHVLLFANEIVAGSDQLRMFALSHKFASGDYYGVLDIYWAPLYPVLLGIVIYFLHDAILSALAISIIAGSLAVPLTYYLVKQSYGSREATIAAAIAIFFPHLINSVLATGTENIYLVIIISALIVGWKGLTRNLATDFALTGILLGLAYLTRPEAIGYPIFFVFLAFAKNLWLRKPFGRDSTIRIAALLLGFALLAAPYIFYLRSETGHWTISAKTQNNTVLGDFQEIDEAADPSEPRVKEKTTKLIKTFTSNIIKINKNFPYLVPPFLLIFVGLGLFRKKWDKERGIREAYLILFCLLTMFGYAASVVQDRYFYILLPIFFGWIALGIVELEQWFNKSVRNWTSDKSFYRVNPTLFVAACLIFIYLYVLPINIFLTPADKAWQTTPYEERDAGLWLKENGKTKPTIFAASARPAFYAQGQHLPPTTTDVPEILRQIRESKVDYVITGERTLKRNPFLNGFDETLRADPQFELIYEKTDRPGYKISIFRLK